MVFADGRELLGRNQLTFDGAQITGNGAFRSLLAGQPLAILLRNGSTISGATRFVNECSLATAGAVNSLSGELRFDGGGDLRAGHLGGTSSLTLTPTSSVVLGAGSSLEMRGGEQMLALDSTLINQGLITGGGPGSTVEARTGVFQNQGSINLANGSRLFLGQDLWSQGPATSWSSPGTVRLHNGEVFRGGGNFATNDLNGFDAAGSTLFLTGNVNNAGRTLTIGGAGPTWNLYDGGVSGGTLRILDQAPLGFTQLSEQSGYVVRLENVRVEGDLSLVRPGSSPRSWPVSLRGGLDLAGTITAGPGRSIEAWNDQTWDGGTIQLRGTDTAGNGVAILRLGNDVSGALTTLTLGSSMTLKGSLAAFALGSGHVVNHGRIVADTPGAIFNVQTTTSDGVIEAINGGHLYITGLTNSGTIKVTGGGVLSFGGSAEVPTRLLPSTHWVRGSGTVKIAGYIENAGQTLTLNTTTGYLAGGGGSIHGGTIDIQSGGGFNLASTAAPGGVGALGFDDVTINGDLVQPSGGGMLRYSSVTLNGTTSLRGTNGLLLSRFPSSGDTVPIVITGGTIGIDSPTQAVKVTLSQGGTVILSPTTRVRGGGADNPGGNPNASLGNSFFNAPQYTTIVNRGTISADVAGRVLTVLPNSFVNEGVVEATNGGRLDLGGDQITWTSAAGTIRATNGGAVWLRGNFTPASLGTLDTAGGKLTIRGSLNNAGNTLNLDPGTIGSLYLYGGGISGGTITTSGQAMVRVEDANGALTNVTLLGGAAVGASAGLQVSGAFSHTGVISLAGDGASLSGIGAVTLPSGKIAFEGAGTGERSLSSTAVLTLGANVVVRGGRGRVFTSTTTGIVNNGRISADVAGQVIRIYQQQFTNNGVVEAINGGQIVFVPPGGFDGPGMPLLNSATLFAGASSTLRFAGAFQQLHGGLLELVLDGTLGEWELGRIEAPEVELGGTLRVSLAGGRTPVLGDTFNLIQSPRITGNFGAIDLPALPGGLSWSVGALDSHG